MIAEQDNTKYAKVLKDFDKFCVRIQQATSIDIHETADSKLKRIKAKENSYAEWFEFYFSKFRKNKSVPGFTLS
ncbi:hypothetical protein ACFFJX_09345 [Pseudarcicella hirudinis]|uniref:hypothetical protein n=1 Tax=Pseudarcicella hirudinis TaxID=1079859 RepID=UPI0035EAAC8E